MQQFSFGDRDHPVEAMSMFGIKILRCEKPPAMFDNSALALQQEETDALGECLRSGYLVPKPEAGR
jgi:hypothetical protein